jgi:hypothetical protein
MKPKAETTAVPLSVIGVDTSMLENASRNRSGIGRALTSPQPLALLVGTQIAVVFCHTSSPT